MEIVVVLTALEVEYRAVRAHLNDVHPHVHSSGAVFEVGRLSSGRGRIAIAVTGAGNQSSAVLAERAIAMFSPQAVLVVGVAGGLTEELERGDVVVATTVYDLRGALSGERGIRARPQSWHAPDRLHQLARYVARTAAWTTMIANYPQDRPPQVHFRPVISGEVVLDSRNMSTAELLRQHFLDIAAIEMESAGVLQASSLRAPVLTIRGVSDLSDEPKNKADQSGWQRAAAAHAAAFAVALASEMEDPGSTNDGRDGFPRRPWSRLMERLVPSREWSAEIGARRAAHFVESAAARLDLASSQVSAIAATLSPQDLRKDHD